MDIKELNQAIQFNQEGLIPVIAQDCHSKKVRMLAYMNQEALDKTLATGKVHYYSRSRQKIWLKGETSGHYQYIKELSLDCDGDALLLQIEQVGGISCHTGQSTCFYKKLEKIKDKVQIDRQVDDKEYDRTFIGTILNELEEIIRKRDINPQKGSYTCYLLEQGENKILKKIGEECTETIIAAKDNEKHDLIFEIGDLIYHLTVLMYYKGIDWKEIGIELKKRK